MKIVKSRLQQIIKEEVENHFQEGRKGSLKNEKVKKIIQQLWNNREKFKEEEGENSYFYFEFPNYGGIEKKIANGLSGDFVDFLQSALYDNPPFKFSNIQDFANAIKNEAEIHFGDIKGLYKTMEEGRRESFPTMEIDPADIEALSSAGEKTHNKVEKLKSVLLEKLGAERLLTEIFDNVNVSELERILVVIAGDAGFLQEEATAETKDYEGLSAAEYADLLNQRSPNTTSTLETDADFWAERGIHTGEDLQRELLIGTFSDLYKEVNGTRPRHVNFKEISVEELEAKVDDLYNQIADLPDEDGLYESPQSGDSREKIKFDIDQIGPSDINGLEGVYNAAAYFNGVLVGSRTGPFVFDVCDGTEYGIERALEASYLLGARGGQELSESPQSGGSIRKGPRDFDLKATSTNWGERDKKKNFQKKFIAAKPGGKRKQYKKQANKKEREQGKKQAQGE